MANPASPLSPKELAKQLRQPEGETGKQVGLEMNMGNKHICLNSYQTLNPQHNNHILEIGMGNGFFIKNLLAMADNLKYTGVDYSATMIQEASLLNKELIAAKKVYFEEASIESLPFKNESFDCITTTNTFYFWPQAKQAIQELLRVLKPKGKLLIAYRSKSFMDQLEFTDYGFKKYESHELEDLLKEGDFKNISTQSITEPAFEFNGNTIQLEGIYTSGFK